MTQVDVVVTADQGTEDPAYLNAEVQLAADELLNTGVGLGGGGLLLRCILALVGGQDFAEEMVQEAGASLSRGLAVTASSSDEGLNPFSGSRTRGKHTATVSQSWC
jgi:hypothetical protein